MWVATCSFKNLLSLWMTRYQRLIPITRQVLPFCLVTIWRNCFLFAPCLPKLRVSLRVVARKSDHTISLATSHHDGHWNDIVTFWRYNRKTSIPNFSFRFETKTVHLEFIPMRLVTARFSPSKTRMASPHNNDSMGYVDAPVMYTLSVLFGYRMVSYWRQIKDQRMLPEWNPSRSNNENENLREYIYLLLVRLLTSE